MRKMVVLVLILTVALRTPIPAGLAQDVPAVEEGTKADREVSRAVVAAAKDLIKKINDDDPTAVEGLSGRDSVRGS